MANFVVPSWRPLHHSRLTFRTTPIRASSGEPPRPEERRSWGRKVDEGMIVLRKRIQESRIADGGCYGDDGRREAARAEQHWTEWERKYYETGYADDVCGALGALQIWLLRSRPGLTIGLTSLLLVGLSASAVAVVVHLVELAKAFVSVAARLG